MKIQVLKTLVLFSLASLPAIVYGEVNPSKLIEDVIYRYEGETQVSRQTLVTCAYKIENGAVQCASTPRKKTLLSVVKNQGEKLRDNKSITLILEPVAEVGIGILQYDYYMAGKDTDQWLYLPEVGNVKRVASSEEAPKSGSLFGSEFSLEDLEKPKLENYDLKVLEAKDNADKNVLVVEKKPRDKYAKKTNYSKTLYWVDVERLLIVKTEYYGWNGDLIKTNFAGNIEKISDIWTVKKMVMRNELSKRISILAIENITYNFSISDDTFLLRILNDAVFQKSKLKPLEKLI